MAIKCLLQLFFLYKVLFFQLHFTTEVYDLIFNSSCMAVVGSILKVIQETEVDFLRQANVKGSKYRNNEGQSIETLEIGRNISCYYTNVFFFWF